MARLGVIGRQRVGVEVSIVTLAEPAAVARPHQEFLPADVAVRYLDPSGRPTESTAPYRRPTDDRLVEMYRAMVIGRRFDQQATALTKQGRLAAYPSSRGQEACQIAAAMSLRSTDWMFPTYRDSVALAARGVAPAGILTMFTGAWHCGYDPLAHRCAPHCTPLATQLVHAAGLAYAESLRGHDSVALALCGDGATSEGDFHEALNFAAVFMAPVVFLVQNNGYAISVPSARQSVAPSLAHKGIGYGIRSEQVDGNDPVALMAVMDEAVRFVRDGYGPMIVEAHTYRIDGHTNADDATRYREQREVQTWLARDPIARLDRYLRSEGLIDDRFTEALAADAESVAAEVRAAASLERPGTPADLFAYVYALPPPHLMQQLADVEYELKLSDDSAEAR